MKHTASMSARDVNERLQWATRNIWLWQVAAATAYRWPEFVAEVRGLWGLRDIGHWHQPRGAVVDSR